MSVCTRGDNVRWNGRDMRWGIGEAWGLIRGSSIIALSEKHIKGALHTCIYASGLHEDIITDYAVWERPSVPGFINLPSWQLRSWPYHERVMDGDLFKWWKRALQKLCLRVIAPPSQGKCEILRARRRPEYSSLALEAKRLAVLWSLKRVTSSSLAQRCRAQITKRPDMGSHVNKSGLVHRGRRW